MQKISFVCDICGEEFDGRDKNDQIEPVGGMNGFYKKKVVGPDKTMQDQMLQYNFDFCAQCNKKMVDYYFKLGGK